MDAASPASRRRSRARPLRAGEFAKLVRRLSPFEPNPTIAIAVSGGADSMALALLADAWARARGGKVVALTVDHGLRPEAAAEARAVGRRLRARGIAHRILTWRGTKPRSGIQAAAREARYRLLQDWCRRNGVLHLMLAHTLGDQAETFLLRLERGSGADGLAGMAAIAEGPDVRLLRPLLAVSKARLVATLEKFGQDWIEDPSNRAVQFARVRARTLLQAAAASGLSIARIAGATSALARVRTENDETVAAWLARCCRVDPAGYIEGDLALLRTAPPDIVRRMLLRCLLCVSGSVYPPRGARIERLVEALLAGAGFRGQTLGGCRLIPAGRSLLICREWSKAAALPLSGRGGEFLWDGRFRIGVSAARRRVGLRMAALGEAGWIEIVGAAPRLRDIRIPAAVRPSLAALFDARGVASVPQLEYSRRDAAHAIIHSVAWRPWNRLTAAGFSVA